MSTQPTEEPLRLVVAFNPVPSASRVAHHHATRFRLAVQAFIVVVIGGLLWALTADAFQLSTVMWMLGAWVVLFFGLFVIQQGSSRRRGGARAHRLFAWLALATSIALRV